MDPPSRRPRRKALLALLIAPPLAAILLAAAVLAKVEIDGYLTRTVPALGTNTTAGALFWGGAFTLLGVTLGAAVGYAVARRRRDQ
jgi:hypothetical protein